MKNIASSDNQLAHQAWYDTESDSSLTMTVLKAVAEAKDTEIEELEPIQHSIDTDCLEEIFCPLSSGGFAAIGDIRFMYSGVCVSIHSTGSIRIYEP